MIALLAVCWLLSGGSPAHAADSDAQRAERFRKDVQPILTNFCGDCHADGAKKGNVAFDKYKSDAELLKDRELWFSVLKYVRSDVMPPAKKAHPNAAQKQAILDWIKSDVFLIDPAHPNPGRVTVHRLNRAEYKNTIRDLMAFDFDTDNEFPADDSGFGFDNISDVLSLSPMLLEKYLQAADGIVAKAVPAAAYVMDEQAILGSRFTATLIDETTGKPAADQPTNQNAPRDGNRRKRPFLSLSYYKRAAATFTVTAKQAGKYRLNIDFTAKGNDADSNGFDRNKIRFAFSADAKQLFGNEYGWHERREFHEEREVDWAAGDHELKFDLTPLTPGVQQTTQLEMHIDGVTVHGPVEREKWVRPANYAHFFPEPTPEDPAAKKTAARKLLATFATRAFRRPIDDASVSRLTDLAESVWTAPGMTYEQGIGKAMTAILSSPRFLYREEATLQPESGQSPLIDEFSLASRLSYFLWSSMPDDELLGLARKSELRKNLPAQVKRMLADSKAAAFTENFTGQWLEARDVLTVTLDARRVAEPDALRAAGMQSDGDRRMLRTALQEELRAYFRYVVESDRNVLEFIDSDYTFLNERLATYYGVTDVKGDELRKVQLPAAHPRGGFLTMGATLMVTSNPTRTSPVKRGQFILDNVLGIPSPPPPANVPPLEESRGKIADHAPTLREQLAVHRESPLCASCHNRMDPLGLSLENFNAYGMWREKDNGSAIEPAGVLITGERFKDVQELKKILATARKDDFFRCLTEKLLIYALGRGMEYRDVGTIDQIVSKLDQQDGKFSALLMGVIDSPAFQRK